MTKKFTPVEAMTISDLETLKVITDPTRINILEAMMGGVVTVKLIAERLDIPATKLYYHVNLLEKHGLIVVVDTQVVSGIIEKHYAAAAESFQIDRSLLAFEENLGEGEFGLIDVMLEPTRREILKAVKAGKIDTSPDAPPYARLKMGRTRVVMTPEQATSFYERMDALLEELKTYNGDNIGEDEEYRVYTVMFALYPNAYDVPKEHNEDDEQSEQ